MADSTEMRISLPNLSLQARSLDISTARHPNKMPFSGVLTKVDEPSDSPPEGSGGKRVMITMGAAVEALESLLGMGVNYNPEGHSPQEKVGVISAADIVGNEIRIKGFIYAADFPEVANEIKVGKDKLGFSFEARDLMTTDADADPVPIAECVFTGAAILLKEKAAYTTTSIYASKAKAIEALETISDNKDFTMNDDVQKNFDALAASIAKVSEAVAAQAEVLKKMEDEKVQAANHLAKVEKHAAELEKAADHMDAAGIGGHPTRGHAMVARNMASDIRAKAARGEMPAVFDAFYAKADEKVEAKVDLDRAVKAAVEDAAVKKASAEFDAKLAEVKAAAEAAVKDAELSAETKLADMQAKAAEAATKSVTAPERKTLAPGHTALLAKAGVELPSDDSKLDIAKLDKAFKEANLSAMQRTELKTVLAKTGVIA